MESNGQRVIYYASNFDRQGSLDQLVECAKAGRLTHVLIGLFHLGYDDETRKQNPYIHFNEVDGATPSLPLKQAIATIMAQKVSIRGRSAQETVKVLASLGGGGVGDFRNLRDAFEIFYTKLETMLSTWQFNGIDLDVEEDVQTDDITKLVRRLRAKFGQTFVITAAPVARSLTLQSRSITPRIDFLSLITDPTLFDFYILQFYNTFGDLRPSTDTKMTPDFAAVVKAVRLRSPSATGKLVAGIPTNPGDANQGYNDPDWLAKNLRKLAAQHYPKFGVSGWTFQNARPTPTGNPDPIGWLKKCGFTPDSPLKCEFEQGNLISIRTGHDTPPAIVPFKQMLNMFYRDGKSGGIGGTGGLMRAISSGGLVYYQTAHLNDIITTASPSAIVFKDKLHVFFLEKGKGGTLQHLESTDGENYKRVALEGLTHGYRGGPAAAVLKKETLCLLGIHDEGDALMYACSSDGKGFSMGNTGVDTTIGMPPTLVAFRDRFFAYYCEKGSKGKRGALYSMQSRDGITWGDRKRVAPFETSAGPRAVVLGGVVHLLFRDAGIGNNGLFHIASYDGVAFEYCDPYNTTVDCDDQPTFTTFNGSLAGAVLKAAKGLQDREVIPVKSREQLRPADE